jgi:hypothetical protein
MGIQIKSPFPFPERLCLFGHAGSGKSQTTLNILRYQTEAHAWVADMDYSFSYERLVATEYPDVADRVHIFTIDTQWEMFTQTLDEMIESADDKRGDWITIDPTTTTWPMVQTYYSDQVHGEDLSDHLLQIRAEAQQMIEAAKGKNKDEQAAAAKYYDKEAASDMTWPLINKLYSRGFYQKLQHWRGNFILVCEADKLGSRATPAEIEEYGYVGQKPKGQKSLPFVAATNLYLAHPEKDKWTITTIKDRGRKLVDKLQVQNFALDYLVEVAGWEQQYVKG